MHAPGWLAVALTPLALIPTVGPQPPARAAAPQAGVSNLDRGPGPARPQHLEVTLACPMGCYAVLRWQDRSNNEDGFTIEHWVEASQGVWALQASWDVGADSTSYLYSNFGEYRGKYRIRAFNGSGVSDWSNWARLR
jgi:hypothetical protein